MDADLFDDEKNEEPREELGHWCRCCGRPMADDGEDKLCEFCRPL